MSFDYMKAYPMEVADSPDTIHTGKCYFGGVVVETNKTDDVVFTVSDGASELLKFLVVGTEDSDDFMLPIPWELTTSMIITLSGTGSKCVVSWRAY